MTREEKNQLIDSLTDQLLNNNNFYLTDISNLNAEKTTELRRLCFRKQIKLQMVKNTLLKKAMERTERNYGPLYDILKGTTSIMFSETGNTPARLIQEFRKKSDKPILKGAYIEEMTYVGDDQLDFLSNIKSKNELIADIVLLLQSPMRNVIGALQSGGQTIHGVLKTLSEKSE
ncbi:MAG: 50S ribosomal protein L10 [Bacteroidetes bacterium]|nr:50S ribosomal protein L10 [Bacteroidota bacterium]